ncbi:MAG: hypothetical protein VKN72_08825 [Nostocales cyanobacterium 94392]|nr:hypothetical protein [Nostocales cyanobacterium 94392]
MNQKQFFQMMFLLSRTCFVLISSLFIALEGGSQISLAQAGSEPQNPTPPAQPEVNQAPSEPQNPTPPAQPKPPEQKPPAQPKPPIRGRG